MNTRTLMIQGTSSHVGKSVLVAGFCRLFTRRGYRVAPFKAQNMALNSFVTMDGREIGRSQAFQARAAGVEPVAEMNPVLLKPSSETGSQVIVLGKPVAHMNVREYHAYQSIALGAVQASLNRLREQFDLVILEGAGSPAEINLLHRDIANMRAARLADAPVLLVGDIERGGVFASLFGTMALLPQEDRDRVKGFIINKFRGDPSLLDSGLEFLEQEWRTPVLGVLPYLHDLQVEEEDSLALPDVERGFSASEGLADIAVIRLPHISNFTDFDSLRCEPGIQLRYVSRTVEWGTPDLVILPGTKSTVADLEWLQEQGLADGLRNYARQGGRTLGICGGYQMLGRRIHDPLAVESNQSVVDGLGLLPVETTFSPEKELSQVEGVGLAGWLEGACVGGYEIHHGVTEREGEIRPLLRIENRRGDFVSQLDGAVNSSGSVAGVYLHGLFDTLEARRALRRWLGLSESPGTIKSSEIVFDRLADWLEANLNLERLNMIVGV